MTSDAKIGLLLGLVFIFVIAFVINGLPSLRPPIGKAEVTTFTGEDFDASVAGKADKAFQWTDAADQPLTSGPATQPLAEEPRPVAQEMPQPAPAQPPALTAGHEGERSSYSLPGIADLVRGLTPTISKDRAETVNVDVPRPVTESPDVGGHQPVVVAPEPKPELKSDPRTELKPANTAKVPDAATLPKPAPAAPTTVPGSKLYVVVAGDNLPAIAKKFYGPEEGNRFVNIDRIFQANQTVLKSPAEILVGQKLIIPPLPKSSTTATTPTPPPVSAPKTAKPADVLPKELFEKPKTISEKVDAWGKRVAATAPAPVPEGRWYTVQNGDSLWKIAASQLGSGARCEEIAKLNADIIPNPETIPVGMRLRLPAK